MLDLINEEMRIEENSPAIADQWVGDHVLTSEQLLYTSTQLIFR